jgi:hypothetical protein
VDESGTVWTSESSVVDGETAAGTHGIGTREDVSERRLTVTEAADNSSTASEAV